MKITVKEKLLQAAEKLMLKQGYNATTIDDICETAKCTKGSFFYYFKNKEEFGKALTREYWKNMKEYLETASYSNLTDPLKRIENLLELLSDDSPKAATSCLLGNLGQEVSETSSAIREVCSECFDELAELFQKEFDAAKEKYGMKKEVSTKELADYFVALSEGALLLAKAKKSPEINRMALKHFREYLWSIFYQ